ncbi:zinc transporter ZIP9-like isoform X1 [Mytilus californianus]|uniref:zinc transporter ZIP9-like isoform X1 n=2 Tax=Mytilus californianus TaxID=6549 RepID=UPI0022475819|nr:zinc transporter ZIP9-like isoform X1 [Mytilus californianus]
MDEIWTLLLLCLAMLIGCYMSGLIPLAITFSEEKLKLVTVFGAGLLVGTALAVIIPEGIHAMYSAGEGHHEHEHSSTAKEATEHKHEVGSSHDHHSHGMEDNHSIIGVTLVIGFIFMLLVDQIGGSHMHGSSDPESQDSIVQQNRNKITATLGLVVHAAADGVALGAAVMLNHSSLTLIVFVAIMLHKAPAAFGLVSFLLHEGFDRPRIKKHLFVFSIAAPLMALVTFICLSQKSAESFTDVKTTGIAMLFSAGTFLYVATVHVLPEVSSGQVKHTNPDGTIIIHEHKGFKSVELVAIVVGAILPVILSLGHKH